MTKRCKKTLNVIRPWYIKSSTIMIKMKNYMVKKRKERAVRQKVISH